MLVIFFILFWGGFTGISYAEEAIASPPPPPACVDELITIAQLKQENARLLQQVISFAGPNAQKIETEAAAEVKRLQALKIPPPVSSSTAPAVTP